MNLLYKFSLHTFKVQLHSRSIIKNKNVITTSGHVLGYRVEGSIRVHHNITSTPHHITSIQRRHRLVIVTATGTLSVALVMI